MTLLTLSKYEKNLKRLELKFKNNKYILGLKYDNLKIKINVVHISVIIASTLVTFIETLREQLNLPSDASTLIPILLSTYVALILSLARFFRLDEQKESLSKLFEKHAFVINRVKHKLRIIKNVSHLTGDCEQILENFNSDGLDDVVTQCMQEIDTLISYKQRIYYENMLATLHINRKVLKRNLNNIDNFDGDMNQYKKKVSMCWYYLTCAFIGSNYVINDTQAFDDIEKKSEYNNGTKGTDTLRENGNY
jgi:hypothetical protein